MVPMSTHMGDTSADKMIGGDIGDRENTYNTLRKSKFSTFIHI